ncbi:MAG: penicillin-binding protein 2 [Patescibacteria group bacterium]
MVDPFAKLEPIALDRKNSLGWVEESCNLSGDCSSGIQTGYLSLALSRRKILALFLAIIAILVVLLAKSFWLQIVGGERYFALAENNRIKIEYDKAHRGVILDRNNKVLVNNLFGFSVSLLPSDLPKDEAALAAELDRLAAIIKVPAAEMAERLAKADQNYYQPVQLRAGIPYDAGMEIKILAEELPGVELNVDAWRQYPLAESLSHVLGYIGKIDADEYSQLSDRYLLNDNIGKAGLEKQYEANLKGVHGEDRIEVDALGRKKKVVSQSDPIPGDNIVLAIDAELQEKVHDILKDKIPAGRGVVIISNPQTGEILSLVDYPSFDNNLFTGGINSAEYAKLLADPDNPLFTRSIFGEYPSGSTIKPVYAAAALQEKIITKETKVLSVGGISVGQWRFPDWKAGGHGSVNVVSAIANSVNTFFYYIGGGYGDFQGLGLDRLVEYLKMFGLGSRTGLDLPGERSGFVPDAKWKEDAKDQVWFIGDTYHLAIGQGDLLVTPMQVNGYLTAVANGGKLFKPRLALEAIRPDGAKVSFLPELIRGVAIDPVNLAIVREGMREAVVSGSARSLSALPVAAAGKTGTAQWNSSKPNHAWFIGFAPYEKPSFAITILVEEGGEGSSVAAPIARDIMQWWFKDRLAAR